MNNEPNTKAEYPPLPEHPEPDGFLTIRIAGRDVEINAYRDSTMRDYAEACIDADRAQRGVEPAPREPLTEESLKRMHHEDQFGLFCDFEDFEQIARAIESAHGITAREEQI